MKETPSQTAGPFLHIGLMPDGIGIAPLAVSSPTDPVTLHGTLHDADGAPVSDALVEMWQVDGPWARCPTDARGGWRLQAARPGAIPFVALWIIARGINTGLHTRLYFPDIDHAGDAAMARVPQDRRGTLVALDEGDGAYRLDIRLGGEDETVFFDV